jgi:hypothetical protein
LLAVLLEQSARGSEPSAPSIRSPSNANLNLTTASKFGGKQSILTSSSPLLSSSAVRLDLPDIHNAKCGCIFINTPFI